MLGGHLLLACGWPGCGDVIVDPEPDVDCQPIHPWSWVWPLMTSELPLWRRCWATSTNCPVARAHVSQAAEVEDTGQQMVMWRMVYGQLTVEGVDFDEVATRIGELLHCTRS